MIWEVREMGRRPYQEGKNYANLNEFYKIIQQDEKSDLLTPTQILLF